MFDFLSVIKTEHNVSHEYVNSIEERLGVKFPAVLREFYTKYNCSDIKELPFRVHDIEFCVDFILPVGNHRNTVEEYWGYIQGDELIPQTFIPFANDIDGDDFYWDSQNGKVYYLSMENAENPIPICNSVDEFFEILNKASVEKIIPNIKTTNQYDNPMQFTQQNNEEPIDVEKILKYNGSFILKCILISGSITILLFLLIPLFGFFSMFIGIATGIYTLIFIIIDIIYRIKTNNVLKKYDINILKNELQNSIKLNKCDTCLTENYIISNSNAIRITKYSDIEWVFSQNVQGAAKKLYGILLSAYLKNGKLSKICYVKEVENINTVLHMIKRNNKDVIIGNTLENRNKYKKNHPKWLDSNQITMIIVILLLVMIVIYYSFIE